MKGINKMIKRFVSVFLCIITVFTVTSAAFIRSGGITAEAASGFTLPYYYYQMSDDAQEFYLYLRKAVKECRSKIKLNTYFKMSEFKMAIELLVYHDPMTFNLDDIKVLDETRNSVTFGFSYKYDKETYDKMVKEYDKATDKILKKFTDGTSTYNKIKIIHDEIIKNTEYDLESENNYNIYGVLIDKKAKCDGYAKAFTYICGKAGIRTVTVMGYDRQKQSKESGHMWNKVYYNKKWYNIDVTWDDPASKMKDNLQYDYFMVSDKALKNTHEEDNMNFKVPKATDDTKGYYVVNKIYAESDYDAERLIRNGLKTAAEKGKARFSVKFASKEIMEHADNYLKDSNKMSSVFKDVVRGTGKKLAGAYYYSFDENLFTVTVYIFYRDTKLDDYFVDSDSLDSEDLEIFEYYGIT